MVTRCAGVPPARLQTDETAGVPKPCGRKRAGRPRTGWKCGRLETHVAELILFLEGDLTP